MNEIILLKLGEMVLKGLNRRSFEDKLQANLHRRLRPFGQFRVYTRQSATYVEPIGEGCDVEGAYEALKHVFGIVGLSLARPCGKDKDAILACAKEFLDDQLRAARTFKVETKRADKTFPMTSIQLSQYVGGELHEAYDNLEVDVHHPELTVYVEVRDYAAYVHTQPQPGAGGLPVGINGRAVSLLSGGIDSPVASWMIAKRGVALDMVHFFSYPYTSLEAKEKVLELARLLTDLFRSGEADEVVLVYTEFASMLSQVPACRKILPLSFTAEELEGHSPADTFGAAEFDPSIGDVMARIVPQFVGGMIFGAISESFASEQAARRTAMEAASDNAEEMISSLSLAYNRARQGAITQEITEISSGFEALR